MEDILVDWLVAFAWMAGISGEGMASIIGVVLLIMVFTVIVIGGKIFFWMLARLGYEVAPDNFGPQEDDNFVKHHSLSLRDSFDITNLNHDL